MLKKGEREGMKGRKEPCEESLRFKITVFCSRRRSTFHDKREGTTTMMTTTTTTSSPPPKTAAPVSHQFPAGMEDRGTLKNGEIEFKSEKNENIPGSKTRKDSR